MKHLKYLSYVIRHKWFVLCACWRRGLYWQGIVHDWSKFLPSEWGPYVEFFYGGPPRPKKDEEHSITSAIEATQAEELYRAHIDRVRPAFDRAWLAHQHRNPHHWQHWVLREDSGATKILEMPEKYRLEMLADWEGAGRAINGRNDLLGWYRKNRDKIQLHFRTRLLVDTDIFGETAAWQLYTEEHP